MRRIDVYGEIGNPVDASRFGISEVVNIIDVALNGSSEVD